MYEDFAPSIALFYNFRYHKTMFTAKKKQALIKKHQRHEKDTGSAEVQVGLLSSRIEELTRHLKKNPKDHSSRRGLLKLVAERRSHEKYLAGKKKH